MYKILEVFDFSVFGKGEITLASVVVLICYVGVLFASILDTNSAIRRDKRFARDQARKAIEEGTAHGTLEEVAKRFSPRLNSWGIRTLLGKLLWYYVFLVVAGFADMLFLITDVWQLFHLPEVPWVSVVLALVFIATEGLSIWENSPKNDTQNVVKSLRRLRSAYSTLLDDEEMKKLRKELNDRGGSGF